MPAQYYLVLSAAVFCIGIFGLLTRRNALLFLMLVELMLNTASINLAAFSYYWGNVTGQTFGLFTMALVAAEVAVGIGIILVLYCNFDGMDMTNVTTMRWQSMAGILDFASTIVPLPFLSLLIALGAGRYMPEGDVLAGIGATAGPFVLSIATFFAVSGGQTYNQHIYTRVAGAGDAATLDFGLLIDPLSSMMLVIVTLVAVLVHIFSLDYMNDEGETDLPRYYAGPGLFTTSMLAFVVSSNLPMVFMSFELVGLCFYLLIGFWFRQEGPPNAAKKAFLVTHFGDYFFLIDVVAVFAMFGSAAFAGPEAFPVLAEEALYGEYAVSMFLGMGEQAWFTVVGLLVPRGVVGKSAQFPLYMRLPDAMGGPIPVSALIHAATMVAASAYLVVRMYGFYTLTPTTLGIIALVGGFMALFAATVDVVKKEIKQVFACSTISQCGYMMLGLGVGGYVASTFHLLTHAFFGALLFLGAGAVIIAMHHNENMWDTGGLKDRMPVTYCTFLSGSLALAGIAPFAGSWSKDEILYETLNHGLGTDSGLRTVLLVACAMGLIAVFFIGFYTFRMVFLTFYGGPRSDTARDPHGFGWNVKFPLAVLGALTAVIGLVNMAPVKDLAGIHLMFLHDWFDGGISSPATRHYLEVLESGVGAGLHPAGIDSIAPGLVSPALALAGVGLAYRLYDVPEPVEHTDKLGSIRTVLYNNYYQDEYRVWIATGVVQPISYTLDKFDQDIIDGAANDISSVSLLADGRVKHVQTGVVSNYVALLTLGLTVLLLGLGLLGG